MSAADDILDAAPEFRCGDATLTRVFRHRWESFARNVGRTDRGFVVTEFHQPGPGRAHGTVNAAAAHHILEARWLRRTDVADDYIRFWYLDPEAEPHRYTEWIAWAASEHARLHTRHDLLREVLPGMVANFEAWERDSLHPSGLYWAHDLADAMEFSVSGDGLRPSINSYQYGNARAIAATARREGDVATADRFERAADELRRLVVDRLYHPELRFFTTLPLSADGEEAYLATAGPDRRLTDDVRAIAAPTLNDASPARLARELIGYLPWYFGLPGADVDPAPAVAQLADPAGFAAPHALRTVERRHPRYEFPVATTSPRYLCRWNGPGWPFATSQTLTALARIARDAPSRHTDELYLSILGQYAAAHIGTDGEYWLDEDIDPDAGGWRTRDWRLVHEPDRAAIGRDYQHSTFADVVLSGLLGIDVADGDVHLDPLVGAVERLGWFEVSGLVLAGVDVSLAWSPSSGTRLTVGSATVTREDLGPLRLPLVARA